jgi:hypothetical protein
MDEKKEFRFLKQVDEDDIILDPEELIAYENLKKAEKFIKARDQGEEEKSKTAIAVLRSSTAINEEEKIKEKFKEIKIKGERWGETLCCSAESSISLENFDDEFERENLL